MCVRACLGTESHICQVPITTLELSLREYQAEIRNALGGTALEAPGLTEVRS